MTKQELEKIVMVNLYWLEETGRHIKHDTPTIGMWDEYGHWSNSYGPYVNETIAKDKQKKLREKLAKQYEHTDAEYAVAIKKLTIPESELLVRDGKYYHKGKKL